MDDEIKGMDPNIPLSNKDFYFKDGLMIFKKGYHMKRGYCCGSGCLHCPFSEMSEGNTELKEDANRK
ncbi:MAG: hypothetical protein CL885_00080, partial [Dehalococcoidia bacterium]|nr:hypothetical protein [Dehalococcoidia bacterium]